MVGSWKRYVYVLRRTYQSQLEKSMRIMRTGGIPEMKGSAVSQLGRRFRERIKGDKELRGILDKMKREGSLNVETPIALPSFI